MMLALSPESLCDGTGETLVITRSLVGAFPGIFM